jgi:membrane protein YqaA with SNARE-associated domain
MRALVQFLFGTFLSTGGVAILAALESTVFFWFPFGIDTAVIILVVRHRELAWLYPILATAGSIAGSAATFWMGRKLGEAELERHIPKRRLESVTARVRDRGAIAIGLLGIIPPPFPLTAFVLASGALEISSVPLLSTLGLVRLFRFGVEAILAARYGAVILQWLDSAIVQGVVVGCILLSITVSAVSLYAVLRRRPKLARTTA